MEPVDDALSCDMYDQDQLDDIAFAWWKYNDKPSRFKSVLLSFSRSKNFDTAIQEWDPVAEQCSSVRCICSQPIHNCYLWNNRHTKRQIVVGSECINKFGTEDMKIMQRAMTKDKGYAGPRRRCVKCLRLAISNTKASYITVCKKCLKECGGDYTPTEAYKKLYYRKCIDCGLGKIPPDSESWMTRCGNCHTLEKQAALVRTQIRCANAISSRRSTETRKSAETQRSSETQRPTTASAGGTVSTVGSTVGNAITLGRAATPNRVPITFPFTVTPSMESTRVPITLSVATLPIIAGLSAGDARLPVAGLPVATVPILIESETQLSSVPLFPNLYGQPRTCMMPCVKCGDKVIEQKDYHWKKRCLDCHHGRK